MARKDPTEFITQKFGPKPLRLDQIGKGIPVFQKDPSYWKYYCPLCGVERRLTQGPDPWTGRHALQIGLTSAVVTLATWPLFNWKGIICFVPIWAVFEALYRMRVRDHLKCDQCGFDPMTYLVDVKQARSQVETFWRERFKARGLPYPGDPRVTQGEASSALDPTAKKETLARGADEKSP